jgi:ATP-dependent DNA helicase RecQ
VDSAGLHWARGLVEEWLEDTGTGMLAALERTGAIRRVMLAAEADGPALGVRRRLRVEPAVRLRRAALAKVEAVQAYARSRGCRRRALLRYFGEKAPVRCGSCDRCGADPG